MSTLGKRRRIERLEAILPCIPTLNENDDNDNDDDNDVTMTSSVRMTTTPTVPTRTACTCTCTCMSNSYETITSQINPGIHVSDIHTTTTKVEFDKSATVTESSNSTTNSNSSNSTVNSTTGSPVVSIDDYEARSVALKDELYHHIKQDESMFDWLGEALGNGIWYLDVTTHDVWYSPQFKELFGYNGTDNVSKTFWMENIFPDDIPKTLRSYKNHLKYRTQHKVIVRYRHKNGSLVWVQCHGKAVFDKDGKPIRMLGVHHDLTELMQVQEELQKKEAVLDLLTSTSLDGYWDWNIVTGELILSTRFKNLLGYADDELPNRIETWWSLLLPEDVPKVKNAIEQCKTNNNNTDEQQGKQQLLNIVLRYRRKNGTIARMLAQGVAQSIPITSSSTKTKANDNIDTSSCIDNNKQWVRMFGTHTDVSYLEEARVARDANAAKTTFLATMSHEIRTPLNAVLGMAQALMATELSDDQKDCVTTLHNSGEHLLSLINDILDFSQIESGTATLAKENVDIQTIVRDVVDVLHHSVQQQQQQQQQNNVVLTFYTEIPAGKTFTGDSERIRQIVFNLVGNAVKFTSNGSVSVSIIPTTSSSGTSTSNSTGTSTIRTSQILNNSCSDFVNNNSNVKDGIYIIVQDTGCGIASDQIDNIFIDFRQAGHEIRSKYGGTGLGLSISKKLIETMGGFINVHSIHGTGSTFTVWLPGCLKSKSELVNTLPTKESSTLSFVNINNKNTDCCSSSSSSSEDENNNNTVNALHSNQEDMIKDNCQSTIESDIPSDNDDNQDTDKVKRNQEQQHVYLYEELICEDFRGSVEGALVGAGMTVNRVSDANDAFQKISASIKDCKISTVATAPTSSFVVVHQQRTKSSTTRKIQTFVKELQRKCSHNVQGRTSHQSTTTSAKDAPRTIPIYIFDVGRSCANFSISDEENGMCSYSCLPSYPTSDELLHVFKQASCSSIIQSESLRRLVRCTCGQPDCKTSTTIVGSWKGTDDSSLIRYKPLTQHHTRLCSNEKTTGPCRTRTSTLPIPHPINNSLNYHLKILLAEDNIINQKVMKKLLSQFPCEVDIASNGLEAVERCQSRNYDLIFMDIIMPELDGLGASKRIRLTDTSTPIVALTANATTDDREDCFEAGMNDFVTKPVSVHVLRKILKSVSSDTPLANPFIPPKS